jgi:hypothetical protein
MTDIERAKLYCLIFDTKKVITNMADALHGDVDKLTRAIEIRDKRIRDLEDEREELLLKLN